MIKHAMGRVFEVEELFTCELCDKKVKEEAIIRQATGPDDYRDICNECLEVKHGRH